MTECKRACCCSFGWSAGDSGPKRISLRGSLPSASAPVSNASSPAPTPALMATATRNDDSSAPPTSAASNRQPQWEAKRGRRQQNQQAESQEPLRTNGDQRRERQPQQQ